MPGSFLKQPNEDFAIAVTFLGVLPEGASLSSGTVSAINETTGLDASATVLESTTAVIDVAQAQAQAYVKAGTAGVTYKLTFLVNLTPGSPVPTLEEDIVMVVRDL